MALDAGSRTYIVPPPEVASATPAASNQVTFVGAAVKGGFIVPEDCDLVEAGAVYTTAGTTTAMVFKLQRSPDTQAANLADLTGVPVGGVASVSCTAPSATQAVGMVLAKQYNVRLNRGDSVVFTVTTAPTAAGGYFYAKTYPAGASASLTSPDTYSTT